MQFLLLIIINIFMGALLYLVISLKLEKSASEFREKKLRKEMDEIIKEFNATAERNISILENKIYTLKRLLERSGDFKTFDTTLGDLEEQINTKENISLEKSIYKREKVEYNEPDQKIKNDEYVYNKKIIFNSNDDFKKSLILYVKKIIGLFFKRKNDIIDYYDKGNEYSKKVDHGNDTLVLKELNNSDTIIEKDLSSKKFFNNNGAFVQERAKLSEQEIQEMVSTAGDKYSMVSILHEKGYPVEEISKYSGIPMGEVKLVLNLNKSR